MNQELRNRIFKVDDTTSFESLAMEIFRYQAANNRVYSQFLKTLGRDPSEIKIVRDIPFIPVELFKNHVIVTGETLNPVVFKSSGTTGMVSGYHHVTDISVYEESFLRCFKLFYGDPQEYFLAALLPSYIERSDSSLAYMTQKLIDLSVKNGSSFYLDNRKKMLEDISVARNKGLKVMLIGVTFALLELTELFAPDLSGVIVVETGGMKGRRAEMTREELHDVLKRSFRVNSIHSEYGMTELLSQAWSDGDGLFRTPPWMKIILREVNDPLTLIDDFGVTGGINIIDLANINSCSFISTGDLGKIRKDGRFEILGRFDNSDLRGCNLLVQ